MRGCTCSVSPPHDGQSGASERSHAYTNVAATARKTKRTAKNQKNSALSPMALNTTFHNLPTFHEREPVDDPVNDDVGARLDRPAVQTDSGDVMSSSFEGVRDSARGRRTNGGGHAGDVSGQHFWIELDHRPL